MQINPQTENLNMAWLPKVRDALRADHGGDRKQTRERWRHVADWVFDGIWGDDDAPPTSSGGLPDPFLPGGERVKEMCEAYGVLPRR